LPQLQTQNYQVFKLKLKNIFEKIFYQKIWRIGFVNQSISSINLDKYSITWFKNSPKYFSFFADPFHCKINDIDYLFFEEYSFITRRGKIAIAQINNDKLINKKILLDNKHLSYPSIIVAENCKYFICESYKIKKLLLYKLDEKNLELIFVKEIFSDSEAIDPTILLYQQKYWLFYTKAKDPNKDLYLCYSDNLLQEFTQHPQNPVKQTLSSARPAGMPFYKDGKIYRPTQYCNNFYGEKIIINEIKKLDIDNFEEQEFSQILPTKFHNMKYHKMLGIHTLSSFNEISIIDGFFKIFFPLKFLVSLMRILKKILSIKNFLDRMKRNK